MIQFQFTLSENIFKMHNVDENLKQVDFMQPGRYMNLLKCVDKSFNILPPPSNHAIERPYVQYFARMNTPITSIKTFPFNSYFAIGTINAIYIASNKLESTITFPKDETTMIYNIDVHPSSIFVACDGSSNNVRIISLQDYSSVAQLNNHKKKVSSIYFLPSVSKIYSTSYDGNLIISDLVKKKECFRFAKIDDGVGISTSVLKDDESVIAIGLDNGRVGVFDQREDQGMISINAHSNLVNSLALTSIGPYLSSCSIDKTMKVWDLRNIQEPVFQQNNLEFGLSKILFINESIIGGALSDGKFLKWDFKQNSLLKITRLSKFGVFCLDIQREDDFIIYTSEDKLISLFYYDL